MFDLTLYWLGLFFILLGSFLVLTGTVGLLRFPDFYTRIHAAGITDVVGTPMIIIGVMLKTGLQLISLKLGLLIIFIFVTSPTSTHALARSAFLSKVKPCKATKREERK